MSADISPDVLEHGFWIMGRNRVMHWVAVTPPPVACPVCEALAWEGCRSINGAPRGNHAKRKTRRTCPCGAALRPKALYCEPCAYERDLLNKRACYRRSRSAA